MRKSAILSLNNRRLFYTIKKNNILILLALCYLVGILLGVFCLKGLSSLEAIAAYDFDKYCAARISGGFFSIFLKSLFSYIPLALIIFLLGTSIAGVAVVPFAVGYCGFRYGVMAAYLYKTHLLQGIAFNALLVIPCVIFTLFCYVLSAREAIGFSVRLIKLSLPKGQAANLYNDFRYYCKRFCLILLLLVCAAIVDAVLSLSFLKLFNL